MSHMSTPANPQHGYPAVWGTYAWWPVVRHLERDTRARALVRSAADPFVAAEKLQAWVCAQYPQPTHSTLADDLLRGALLCGVDWVRVACLLGDDVTWWQAVTGDPPPEYP